MKKVLGILAAVMAALTAVGICIDTKGKRVRGA